MWLGKGHSTFESLLQIPVRVEAPEGTVMRTIVGVTQDLWIRNEQQACAVLCKKSSCYDEAQVVDIKQLT